MGNKAASLLRLLAKEKYGEENKAAYARFIAFHRMRIAVAVQRGNALVFDLWRGSRRGNAAPAIPVEIEGTA